MTSAHDSERGQMLAGFFHLGFAALYVGALLFHLVGAKEHFERAV